MLRQVALLLTLVSIVSCYDTEWWLTQLSGQALPRAVVPSIYYLELHPRIQEGYFNGSVNILLRCLESTDVIVLHAHQDLQVQNITLSGFRNWSGPAVTEVWRNKSTDTLTLALEEKLHEGQMFHLKMEFHGQLKDVNTQYVQSPDNMADKPAGGFFRGSYEDVETEGKRWLAMTSMFPGFARRVFPCFDEPFFKAHFSISVARLSKMTTLTSSPWLFTDSTGEDYVKDYFHMTPRIAPCSVGLVVSDVKNVTALNVTSSQGSFELKVYYGGNQHQPEGNMKLVPKMLQVLQDYLQVPYGFDKLDIVAAPIMPFLVQTDTASMGLIILQEFMVSDRYIELYNALVRQWVNHMVTPETWSAFNVSDVLGSYLTRSALLKMTSKRPWLFGESRSNMYEQLATNINVSIYGQWPPYAIERGVWFLEMLNQTLGKQTFRKALQKFFRDNMYGTITEHNLWTELTVQALAEGKLPGAESVEQVARSWLVPDSLHYPVLTLTRNYDDRSASLEQHVFSSEQPRALTPDEEALLWWLPVMYLSPGAASPHLATWMGTRHLEVTGLPDAHEYVAVNPTDAGMFLVNYDRHNWRLLMQHFPQLPAKTRAKLLNDALLLARGGELDYVLALNVTLGLVHETDYSIWTLMLNQINNIQNMYSYTPVEDKLNEYLQRLLTQRFDPAEQPDYERDSDYANFWFVARDQLYRVGYQPRVDEAHERLQQVMPTFLVNDTSSGMVLFCPEFMRDDFENWETRIEELQNFLVTEYDTRIFLERSLGQCPGYSELIERLLNRTLDEDAVFTSNSWYSMQNLITSTSKAQNLSFEFLIQHYKELKHKFYFMQDMWTSLVTSVTANIKTDDALAKLKEFYNQYEGRLGYTKSVFEDAIKQAEKSTEWRRRNLGDIQFWLDEVLPRAILD